MGARMVAFLESLLSGLDCLDCLAEKGKPESKRHKLETPQLMLGGGEGLPPGRAHLSAQPHTSMNDKARSPNVCMCV